MEYIQKHISIEREFLEKIEPVMKMNGQKLSPLVNSLLIKYFSNLIQNKGEDIS